MSHTQQRLDIIIESVRVAVHLVLSISRPRQKISVMILKNLYFLNILINCRFVCFFLSKQVLRYF